jgi:hypothetical protein
MVEGPPPAVLNLVVRGRGVVHAVGVEDLALEDPWTLHGQLQRGRGEGARRALAESGAGELVYDCIRRDPRWDHQVEARALFLVRLVLRMDMAVEPISAHLFDAADRVDDDEWRVDLAINVLVGLVRSGRSDALTSLRRYVVGGRHWRWALDAMWSAGDSRFCQGLAGQVLARVSDRELADAVDPVWGPWVEWSRTEPRVRAAVEAERQRRVGLRGRQHAAGELDRVADADRESLIRQVREGDRPVGRRLAVVELGRRGDLAVLALAEDPAIRNSRGGLPGLTQALNELGGVAVKRARSWVSGGDDVLVAHGIAILAEHGDQRDVDVLLARLIAAVRGGDWCATEQPARGLGRLQATAAAPMLLTAWRDTSHSYARADILIGLQGAAPQAAQECLGEGLDDCEPDVRRISCQAVDLDLAARARVRVLGDDPLEEDEVRAAARNRLQP